jgi:hypothetical protein
MKIDVVLRTCSNSLLTPKTQSRVCGDNREVLIRKCFVSLVRAIRHCTDHKVKLTVLDDNSDSRFLEFIRSTAAGLEFELVSLDKRGPNNSALAQFKFAAECAGLVYVVEDDYLHEDNALNYMLGAYLHFMRRYNKPTIIFPYDCSLRYSEGEESPTTLYHDGVRYWRSVDKTSNTMFTHYSTIKENWSEFEDLARNYPKVLEDDTINRLYYSASNVDAPIRVYSPIPSIAYHVGYSTITDVRTSHTNWHQLWNSIPDWDLVQGWFYYPEFYQHALSQLPEGGRIVEIGAWRGRSTCCMASLIKASGKTVYFYTVDTWEGSAEEEHRHIMGSLSTSLFEDFSRNLEMCGVTDLVKPLRMTSVEASKRFTDKSLDFVMIDGAHDYDSVKQDIEHWLPKMKSGGVIAGDDFSHSWPGVTKVVTEAFGNRVNLYHTNWYVVV